MSGDLPSNPNLEHLRKQAKDLWRGVHILETMATKDGQVVARGGYEVSADGKTSTISDDQQRIGLGREEMPTQSPG
jgi:hypothetical protein